MLGVPLRDSPGLEGQIERGAFAHLVGVGAVGVPLVEGRVAPHRLVPLEGRGDVVRRPDVCDLPGRGLALVVLDVVQGDFDVGLGHGRFLSYPGMPFEHGYSDVRRYAILSVGFFVSAFNSSRPLIQL